MKCTKRFEAKAGQFVKTKATARDMMKKAPKTNFWNTGTFDYDTCFQDELNELNEKYNVSTKNNYYMGGDEQW
jgi:hypothetical protein